MAFSFSHSTGRDSAAEVDTAAPRSTPRSRLAALLDYIEQVEKLNRKPAFLVPADFYCGYEEELRGLPGVELNLTQEGDEVWLRIRRLDPTDPPAPEPELAPWLVLPKNPHQAPRLREEIDHPTGDEHAAASGADFNRLAGAPRRSQNPGLEQAFERYLAGAWSAWATSERAHRKTIALYDQLFVLQQSMEAEGADKLLELVWGVGIAVWAHESGQRIAHPVLTQQVEISLDRQSLALEVRPRDRPPVLESDPFGALDLPGVVHLERAWRTHLDKAQPTLCPFDAKTFTIILKASVGFLDSHGCYWPEVNGTPEDRSLPSFSKRLAVTDTWVLFARKRSPSALIEDLERLRASLAQTQVLPGGPAALVSAPAHTVIEKPAHLFRGLCPCAHERAQGEVHELYFPKPYNTEQVSIVQKLEVADGVVVQGPPGTGKTHTIANIICHTLAKGGRVLVTSKGEPALAVLREHIPEALRALSVALLTDEKDGMSQFEHAIQTIAAAISRIDPPELERNIAGLRNHIDALHVKLAGFDRDMAGWAKWHLSRVQFRGQAMLPEELARYVTDNAGSYAWLPDELAPKFTEPAFTAGDISALRGARLALGRDLSYLDAELPPADALPDGADVARLHQDLGRAAEIVSAMAAEGLPQLANSTDETLGRAQALFARVQELTELREHAYRTGRDYTASLYESYRLRNTPALAHLDELCGAVHRLERERQAFVQRPVEVHADAELDLEFAAAVERGRRGMNPLGLLPLGKSKLKLKLQSLSVSGLHPQHADDWAHVQTYLDFRKRMRATAARWNATAAELHLAPLEGSAPEALRALVSEAEHIALVKRLATELEQHLPPLVREVFGETATLGELGDRLESLFTLQETLSKHLMLARLAYAQTSVAQLLDALAGKSGALVDAMRHFLGAELGDKTMSAARAADRWGGFIAELRRLARLRAAFVEVARVTELVERASAPKWARALRTEPALGSEDKWTTPDWLEAWQWRQACAFLARIDGRDALTKLQALRHEAELELAHSYQTLIERKTWLEVHRNSPPAVTAALQAYLNAVKHIGRGTGIRAARYRSEARAAMLDAYRAVPCWIMPHWRVSETLPAELGKFDLVIVDEASQSDLWALPSLLRGAKLMIVGDDRQVSPDGIGFAEEKIKELKSRFLRDQVFGDQMTPEKSLYDLAKVVFSSQSVMLREHFRCVPPIIEFSKREFYRHDIQPLRVPKASERLDPPLIDVFIRGAERRGNVNEAEARAIVREVEALIADPRCAGRSIGVVSLLGIEQAERIFHLLRGRLRTEDMVARRITVGDARTFQGKERDIMLLSMVATPAAKMTATGSTYEQRFNVAASRARDRMVLFRSVEPGDLNPVDLKARLIEHFAAPFQSQAAPASSLRELCESAFELELFDALVARGYRVQPHVRTGAYSIDLVVEGERDQRLAIECDGDQYHGPERWSADMARQRVLERAGWTFWRCFASSFRLRRDRVMDDLLATLTRMGIEPNANAGAEGSALGQHTEHRVVDAVDAVEASAAAPFAYERSR